MADQVVVRTYPKGWTNQMTSLQSYLSKGYKVVHITPLPDGITEYIIEKEIKDKKELEIADLEAMILEIADLEAMIKEEK